MSASHEGFRENDIEEIEEEVVFIATSTKGRSGWGHHPYTQKYKLFHHTNIVQSHAELTC